MLDLLSFLGLAWPRLLLYPGGAFALALLWLGRRVWPAAPATADAAVLVAESVPPLLLLCLLPLPGAAGLPRSLDLPTALALLEWPVALWLLMGGAADTKPQSRADVQQAPAHKPLRLCASAVNVLWRSSFLDDAPRTHAARYAPLLLAACALVLGSRSLALDAFVREPPPGILPRALIAVGAACWLLWLPPLLGPVAAMPSPWRLRFIGHGLLAATFWLALLPFPWLAPLPIVLVFLLLFPAERGGARVQRAWRVAALLAAITAGALILAAAIAALSERLR